MSNYLNLVGFELVTFNQKIPHSTTKYARTKMMKNNIFVCPFGMVSSSSLTNTLGGACHTCCLFGLVYFWSVVASSRWVRAHQYREVDCHTLFFKCGCLSYCLCYLVYFLSIVASSSSTNTNIWLQKIKATILYSCNAATHRGRKSRYYRLPGINYMMKNNNMLLNSQDFPTSTIGTKLSFSYYLLA